MATPGESGEQQQDGIAFLTTTQEGTFLVTESNSPPESVKHKPTQSYLLSIGIDNGHKQASRDTKHLSDTLVRREVIPRSNALVLSSSSDHDKCTVQSIRECFKSHGEKTGQDGIFIFIYHGPGVQVDSNEWSLQAVDFKENNAITHITGATLMQWLSHFDTKPKHVIFIIDCSVACEVASDFKASSIIPPMDEITVLSTCSYARETHSIGTLGHSIFSYFAAQAFHSTRFVPDLIPLRDIFDRIKTCTYALSSLIVTYDPENRRLQSKEILVKSAHVRRQCITRAQGIIHTLEGDEEDDIDADVGRFEFLTKHYERGRKHRVSLHTKALAWLECVQDYRKGPLAELHVCKALDGEVLLTAFCLMMFSLMSFQVALDRDSVREPNLLILMFLTVASTINSIDMEAEITDTHFRAAKDFIFQVMGKNAVNTEKMEALYQNIIRDKQQVASRD